MAITKIWPVKDSLKRVIEHAKNVDKTENLEFLNSDLYQVLHYAVDENKTKFERQYYVTGINCAVETVTRRCKLLKKGLEKQVEPLPITPVRTSNPTSFPLKRVTQSVSSLHKKYRATSMK